MKKPIQPDQWEDRSPEHTLAEFLLCWQRLDFEKAVEYTQTSWRKSMKEAEGVLASSFAHKQVERLYYIDRTQPDGLNPEVILELKALIEYRIDTRNKKGDKRHKTRKKIIVARVIREDEGGSPDPAGTWGVNPVSVLREY